MEKDKLKLELLERIIACDDEVTLERVKEILLEEISRVEEGEENYLTEVDPVPSSHYQNLEEDFNKLRSGEIKGISLEDLGKEIKSKHGF